MRLLEQLHGAGFTLKAFGGQLVVSPASCLTDDLRAAIRVSADQNPRLFAAVQFHGQSSTAQLESTIGCVRGMFDRREPARIKVTEHLEIGKTGWPRRQA